MPVVLVVDDEPSVRSLLEVTLEMEGYDVVSAPEGETALRLAAECRPDVMVLDVMMPKMDGWEVAASLKGSGIPIVLMSGLPLPEIESAPGRHLVAAVMGKPFDSALFLELVAQALRSGAAAPRRQIDLTGGQDRLQAAP